MVAIKTISSPAAGSAVKTKRPNKAIALRVCSHPECTKSPYFGWHGESAVSCVAHKEPGMVDVKNKRCEFEGCMKRRLFGFRGERARFCGAHRQEGMVDLKNKRCKWIGCTKQANFSERGKFVASFCEEHRSPGMVDIKGARCDADGCTKVARFGVRGGQPTACALHREPHMCKIKKRRPDQSGMGGDASGAGVSDAGGAAAADALREDPPKGMAPLPPQGRGVAVGGLDNVGNHGISNGAVNTGMISCKLEDNSGNVGNHGISYGGVNTGVINCKLEDNTGDGGGNIINGINSSSSSSSSNGYGYGSAPPLCPPPTSNFFQPPVEPDFLRCADSSAGGISCSQQPCGENINGAQTLPLGLSQQEQQGQQPFPDSSIGSGGLSTWAPPPQAANDYCSSSSSGSDGPSCQFPRSSPHSQQQQQQQQQQHQSSFGTPGFPSERPCNPPAINVNNCGGGDGSGGSGFEVGGTSFTEGGGARYPGFGEQQCLQVGAAVAAAAAPKEEEYERNPEFLPVQADRLLGTPGGRLDVPSEIPEIEPADVWLGDLMRQAMTQENENATAQQQPKHEMKPDTSGGMSYPLGAQQQFFLSHLSRVGSVSYFLPKHLDEGHQPTARMNPTARATASWPPCHPVHHKQHTPHPSAPPESNLGWVKDAGSAVIGELPTTALYPSSTTNVRSPSMSTASTDVSPLQGPGITSYDALPQGDCRLDAVGGGARTATAGGVCGDLSSGSNGGPPLIRTGACGPHDHPVAAGGVFPGGMAAIKTEFCHHSFPPPGAASLGSSTHWSAF
ncbi:unnamed protein product [Ectocarpus sp. 12 AP-2014]